MTQSDTSSHPLIGKTFGIPRDGIAADLDLQDDKDQALQDAYSAETAAETMIMPESQLKEGLDRIAFDEHSQDSSSDEDEAEDDWREHIEDMDEADKDR